MKKKIQELLQSFPRVSDIVVAINQAGGRALLVGGAVRDLLLGIPVKDIDIEVHGLLLEQLESVLKKFGPVSLVGKVFGVFRVHGLDADWSLPRADEPGRKPKVAIDPSMKMRDAFARRDLTMNAMGIDLVSGELIDPFGGQHDLKAGVLRAPDPKKFVEDPLRFFRVMQFISRFNMHPDDELNELCKSMDVSTVSRERIEGEMQKLLLKSKRPSLGIRWLKDIGRLDIFPELAALVNIPQEAIWHPEGDVFEHTMQGLDAAAQLPYENDEQKLIVMYGALCHDLGKAVTTEKIDGLVKSLRHESVGVGITKRFLKRITQNKDLIDAVIPLVKAHMIPTQLIKPEVKLSAFKRLAKKVGPHVTLEMLAKVCLADKLGRNPQSSEPLTGSDPEIDEFLRRAHEARVVFEAEKPVLMGRDLLDVIKPGPELGKLLKQAYEIQIEEGITDKDELRRRVLENK